MTTHEQIAVLLAFECGKPIEWRWSANMQLGSGPREWKLWHGGAFNFADVEYRVKE